MSPEPSREPQPTREAPELSAVVLCYRSEESVVPFLDAVHDELLASGTSFELVLVANFHAGSRDRTPEIAAAYATAHPHVRVVALEKLGGMGWDMRSGLAASRGDVIVVIDGDGESAASDVLRMYRELRRQGMDVIKGVRSVREDSLYRRLLSRAYNLAFRLTFWTWDLWDINGKPKALTREALERLDLRSDDWFVDAEIVLEARGAGLTIAELPVEYHRTSTRKSFVRPGAIVEFLANMLARRFRRS